MKRRLFVLLICLGAVFLGIGGKLLWIQLVAVHHYTGRNVDLVTGSVRQREKGIVLHTGRGVIEDRSRIPFTSLWQKVLVITPVAPHFRGKPAQIQALARLLGLSPEEWNRGYAAVKEPVFWRKTGADEPASLTARQAAAIEKLGIPNVKVMPYVRRYPSDMTARQAIGFVSQDPDRLARLYPETKTDGLLSEATELGASGIEKAFEPYLRGVGRTSVSFYTDANKRPLQGLHMRLVQPKSNYYPLHVVTTLDSALQRRIEKYVDVEGMKEGAVVVMDVRTAEVLASVSRPQFDPGRIGQGDTGWANAAVKAVTPGSIFKAIIAAAALEEHVVSPHEEFECHGELGKYGLSCWKKVGHGSLTLAEAFAESCNVTFAKVASRLSPETVERYARKLGFNRTVGWTGRSVLDGSPLKPFDGEEEGQVFAAGTARGDGGVIAQTGIGQRDVLVTPLQAANLAVTLVNGGKLRSPQLVKRVDYANGSTMVTFGSHLLTGKEDKPISEATAKLLREWMGLVVSEGTGRSLQNAEWTLAGKSGTAQIQVRGEARVNQWFLGFGPADKPRYAVSVLVKNESPHASHYATRWFKGVMDLLAETEQEKNIGH
ncbi:peptidoglycan D,D-transpeptidase FtsI family protein [Paenibacillus gansuensis]|uniref:Peptidoglycan D,D-transpeptidase FtsI family protein n=1 Tax=Paenibacillus gansuensis TaxID=306542 RepID=A0ABW5PDR1_9BACL